MKTYVVGIAHPLAYVFSLSETINLMQDRADNILKRRYLGNKLPVLTLFKGVTQTAAAAAEDLIHAANTFVLKLMEKWT